MIDSPELLLVRYGELALKGGNRRQFEEALVRNIRHAARDAGKLKVRRTRGRLEVRPDAVMRLTAAHAVKSGPNGVTGASE